VGVDARHQCTHKHPPLRKKRLQCGPVSGAPVSVSSGTFHRVRGGTGEGGRERVYYREAPPCGSRLTRILFNETSNIGLLVFYLRNIARVCGLVCCPLIVQPPSTSSCLGVYRDPRAPANKPGFTVTPRRLRINQGARCFVVGALHCLWDCIFFFFGGGGGGGG